MIEIILLLAGLATGVVVGYLLAAIRLQQADAGELVKAREELANERNQTVRLQAEKAGAEQQIKQGEETKRQLKQEFENLANKIFEERSKVFSEQHKTSLESLLKPFGTRIEEFRKRVDQVHSESTRSNATIRQEIKNVVEASARLSDNATNLTTALKGDKKTTGNWGEVQLEQTLQMAGLVDGVHYESQHAFKDEEGSRYFPDFLIKLPDGKHMIIDSKVSLVDYDRAIAAATDEERKLALDAHTVAVRNHIDQLSKKDYSGLKGVHSPNFVLMFMPIEPAYIEAMKHNRELFNEGYHKGVVMVSHTTLMPILRTVGNLWMLEQSNAEARELGDKAGAIYNQVCVVAGRLRSLGGSLQAANNHYNKTVTSLAGKQGLHGKVERFQEISSRATGNMPDIQALHSDIESNRLEDLGDGDEK